MKPTFEKTFAVGPRALGEGQRCFVIAEAGVAHFGDVDMANQLLDLAIEAGADAFKLQVFDVDRLFTRDLGEWKDRLRPRVLEYTDIAALRQRCAAAGLAFMLTTHDESRIPWLASLDVDAVKVGSGERNNLRFLQQLAALDKPMIVSTGLHAEADVAQMIDTIAAAGCHRLAVLHCVSSYPIPPQQVNLRAMDRLRALFPGPVGYSDHTEDDLAICAAVARGAQVIERHITILRNVPNAQDWKVSSGPEDFPQLVEKIRRIEAQLGHGRIEVAEAAQAATHWALKSLVAATGLAAGTTLAAEHLVAKRPGGGIPPDRLEELLGRQLAQDVAEDTAIKWTDLQ